MKKESSLAKIAKKPVIFEFLLCSAMILLFFFSSIFQLILFSILGITSRNLFTDVMGIIASAAVFSIIIAVGLRIQKLNLTTICFFKKVSPGIWGALFIFSIGFVFFNFYINFLFYSFKWGWDPWYYRDEGNIFTNTIPCSYSCCI